MQRLDMNCLGLRAAQAEAAGGDEVADAPLHDEGHEQEQRQLRIAEEIEIAGFEEKYQVGNQQQLKGEGRGRRELRPHLPIQEQPQHRPQRYETGGEDQKRFLEAGLGVVIRTETRRTERAKQARLGLIHDFPAVEATVRPQFGRRQRCRQ